ncbi:MAG: tetratricopeptide repeat protein [Lysobacteraceae bacterium]
MSDADVAQHNRAVGLMGQYRNEDARQLLSDLVDRHPTSVVLRTDLAIATLNRQQDGDEEHALGIAEQALAMDSGAIRPRYVAGLAELYLGRVEAAAPRLRAVTDADPKDGHAAYFAAQALAQLGDDESALTLYQRGLNSESQHPNGA